MLTRALWVAAILGLAAATTLEVKGFGFQPSPPALAPAQALSTGANPTAVTSVCRTKAGCWIEFQGTNTRVQTITYTGTTRPAVNNAGDINGGAIVLSAATKKALLQFDQTLNFVDTVKTVTYDLSTATRACTPFVVGAPSLALTAPTTTLHDGADNTVANNGADVNLCKTLCNNALDDCFYWVQSTINVLPATAPLTYKVQCDLYSTEFPAGGPALAPPANVVAATIFYGSCPYTNAAQTYKLALQFDDTWDTASTFQSTTLTVNPAGTTNAQRIAVPLVTYTPTPTYTYACSGLVECSNTDSFAIVTPTVANPTLNFASFVTINSVVHGYVWVRAKTGKVGAHKFGVADQPAITVTSSGSGTPYTIPLSLSGVFAGLTSANFAPGVISANGEVGKAVSTATPNTTLEVNSIRSQRVLLDDEFRTVASGIVYAAVGSAFAFVLCLGAVAAAIGSKAAAKGVTQ